MRIIAGTYRRRLLEAPDDLSVRPTTDRAKQTIFDILTARKDLESTTVLDLFAGSGSLGLEALSRGAASVSFVDNARKSLALAERNAKTLGCEARCTFYLSDVFWYLKSTKQSYDIVFADPPYALKSIGEIPERVLASTALTSGGFLVMEHSKESSVQIDAQRFEVIQKPFGQTTVLILKKLA